MIKNQENIRSITMFPQVKCYCPLGKAWYTNQFKIELEISDKYPDYLDVEDFIEHNIECKELTIEKTCLKMYEYFKSLQFDKVKVTSFVNDASHSNVEVVCGD